MALSDVHIAEVDLNYAKYCPLNRKYEAIYPPQKLEAGKFRQPETGNGGETERALASRPAMWRIVEKCMEDGTLDALREGKMNQTLAIRDNSSIKKPSNRKPSMKKALAQKIHAEGPGGGVMIEGDHSMADPSKETNDDSDGGFFET